MLLPDTSRPYIKATNPISHASGVSISSVIIVEFSERMKASTFTSSSVGLYRDPTIYTDSTLTYVENANSLVITPSGSMNVNSRYSVGVSGTVQDYNGNPMTQNYWWTFWTGQPSGYVSPSSIGNQPTEYPHTSDLSVVSTIPKCYTTDYDTDSISPIRIELNDICEIGNRNYLGSDTDSIGHTNPASFGEAFFEDTSTSLGAYISIENTEVLGRRYIDHTAPTYTVSTSDNYLLIDGTGWVDNNEYIVSIKKGLPGVNTNPLSDDYEFVFTSTYSPLYSGASIIRLNIGPMLQMVMAYIPNDTLNRFAYEASIQADRIYPLTIDPDNIPWYVEEFVIYQCKLNALYAAIMLFAGSGAGITKSLADLSIAIDARGLMPALLPIIEDYKKLRDLYMGMTQAGTDSGPKPQWAVKAQYDIRRPITSNSWVRLPFKDVRADDGTYDIPDDAPKWNYVSDTTSTRYLSYERYLVDGRYVSSE